MSELLIGCGNARNKQLSFEGIPKDWTELTTLDVDPSGAATESAGADDTAHAAVPAGWPARAGAFAIDVLAGVGVLAAVFLLASAAPAPGEAMKGCGLPVMLRAWATSGLLSPSRNAS